MSCKQLYWADGRTIATAFGPGVRRGAAGIVRCGGGAAAATGETADGAAAMVSRREALAALRASADRIESGFV